MRYFGLYLEQYVTCGLSGMQDEASLHRKDDLWLVAGQLHRLGSFDVLGTITYTLGSVQNHSFFVE